MPIDITKRDFYLELKKERDSIFEEYDSILYPYTNGEDFPIADLYFHITDISHPMFALNQHFPKRQVSECTMAYRTPEIRVRYYDKEIYELPITDKKENDPTIIEGRLVDTVWLFELMPVDTIEAEAPPLFLCKGQKIIAVCKNNFLDRDKINNFDYDITMVEIQHYIHEKIREDFIKIQMGSSVKTKIDAMDDMQVDRIILEKSPLLEKGVCIIQNKSELLSIWRNDTTLFFFLRKKYNKLSTPFSIKFEELPSLVTLSDLLNLIENRVASLTNTINQGKLSEIEMKYDKYWYERNATYSVTESSLVESLVFSEHFCEIEVADKEKNEFKVKPIVHLLTEEIFDILRYTICLNITGLNKYVKGGSKGNVKFTPQNTKKYSSKIWKWGNDNIRYVYPPKKSSNKKIAHYVRPHLCKTRIKKTWNYQDYTIHEDEKGFFVIKYRSGCWKGMSNILFYLGSDKTSGYSRKAISWLKKLEKEGHKIQHAENGGEVRVELGNGKYYLLDGYCEETNTVYEFHGNIYHGNPRLFSDDEKCHPHSDKTAKELFEATIQRENNLRKMGYNLVVMWEDEYDKVIKNVMD